VGPGAARDLASAVRSCLARLFRGAMPARQPRTPRFLLESLPALCHLSLSSSSRPACCRGRRPSSSFPHLPRHHVPGLKLSPPQRISSAQTNIQQHPRSPLHGAQLGSAQRWQFNRDFWTESSFLPPDLGSLGGFFWGSWVSGCSAPLGTRTPPCPLAWLGVLGLAPRAGGCCEPGSVPGPQPG